MLKRFSLQSVFLWLLVIFFAASISVWYVSRERFFYFWDYTFYMKMAVDISKIFVRHPFQAMSEVYLSTVQDYNDYFALPLIPFLKAFQYSRLGYILGLVFIYHVPTLSVCGSIVRKIFPSVPYAGWITIFAGLSVPALWASMYRGFPDTGAVLFLSLAMVVYLNDMELKQWKVQLPVIGILSALAVVFRRHFAYTAISFLFSMGVFLLLPFLLSIIKDWKRFMRDFWNALVKVQIAFAFFLLTVLLLAPSILLKAVSIDYLDLYSSYATEPIQVFTYFIAAYGILFLLAGFGYLAGLKAIQPIIGLDTNAVMDKPLYFVLFFGATSFFVWVLIPRQADVHYVLHIAPMIVVGLGVLIVTALLAIKISGRFVITGLISVVMVYNLWAGLSPVDQVPFSTSTNYPPLSRSDFDEVIRLVDYLRGVSGRTGNIYVVDSSLVMNNEILHSAEVYKYGTSSYLQVLNSPQIDSRDYYPLNPFLRADYVLVSTPFQYHLIKESEQKVVKFASDAFHEQWVISKDFKKLPEEFHLANGVITAVYERQSPTSLETALLTFLQMKEFVGRMPGMQSDWVLTNPVSGRTLVDQTSLSKYSLTLMKDIQPLSFLYVSENTQGVLSGKVTPLIAECARINITAEFYAISETVSLVHSKQIDVSNGEFDWNVEIPENTFLVLRIGQSANSEEPACDQTVTWELLR